MLAQPVVGTAVGAGGQSWGPCALLGGEEPSLPCVKDGRCPPMITLA